MTGLTAGNSVTLNNNAADPLTLTANGAFTFASQLISNSNYNVTIAAATQNCAVTSGAMGTVSGGNVTSVNVDCGPGMFAATNSLSTVRDYHTATPLVNGKVLVSGGRGVLRTNTATAELYDPATNLWASAGTMNNARRMFTGTLLANGKVLVSGGIDATGNLTATAELYDPATNQWTVTGSLTTARYWHVATLLANGKVLVSGGGVGGQAILQRQPNCMIPPPVSGRQQAC